MEYFEVMTRSMIGHRSWGGSHDEELAIQTAAHDP